MLVTYISARYWMHRRAVDVLWLSPFKFYALAQTVSPEGLYFAVKLVPYKFICIFLRNIVFASHLDEIFDIRVTTTCTFVQAIVIIFILITVQIMLSVPTKLIAEILFDVGQLIKIFSIVILRHVLPSIPIKYSKTWPFCKQKIKSRTIFVRLFGDY